MRTRADIAADAARALSIAAELGAQLTGTEVLAVIASLVASDHPREAAQLLAAADALRSRYGMVLPRHEADRRAALIETLGGTLATASADVTIEAAAPDTLRLLEDA